ncbi:MAG: 2-C-methyl-D-erythritol 4-phosphate cytidylyltransferase [Proteobacteria bacterium]|nr:2-C-methyl-D-erythritol 4-phosphate cytidylyltransferase [Pseudomonadota bacterium]
MNEPRFWLVVPAAGTGRRLGAELPKQYQEIGGRCMLAHALQAFADWGNLSGTVLAIDDGDRWFAGISGQLPLPVRTVAGGAERMHSVINAVQALQDEASEHDWVLVHDAARPCLCVDDLRRLLTESTGADGTGGLLASRVMDTLKKASGVGSQARAVSTMARQGLWQAMTPQVFPYGLLRRALEAARKAGKVLGDEAAAMELAGHRPLLVEGRRDNIKVTQPADLALAEAILAVHRRD